MTCLSGCVVLHVMESICNFHSALVGIVLCRGRIVLCCSSLLVFPSPEHCFGTCFLSLTDLKVNSGKLPNSPCIPLHLHLQTIKDEKLVTVTGATELRVTITCKELRKHLSWHILALQTSSNSLRCSLQDSGSSHERS